MTATQIDCRKSALPSPAMTTPTLPRPETVTRVVKFVVDDQALTTVQRDLLDRHAGTARAAFNWGLATINAHEDAVRGHVRHQALVDAAGNTDRAAELLDDRTWRTTAYKTARGELGRRPSGRDLGVQFTAIAKDPDSRFGWWETEKKTHGVNRFAVSAALDNLHAAVGRALDGTAAKGHQRKPRKDGRPHGWPRFKKKHISRDAFALFNVALGNPWKPVEGGHRLKLPNLGSLRMVQNTRPLRRLIQRGGHPKSARFTRHGRRWTIAITVSIPAEHPSVVPPAAPNRIQTAGGPVGIDLGVLTLAALSTGELVPNPRTGLAETATLKRLRRKLDRQHRAGSPACFDDKGRHAKGPCPWRGTRNTPATMSRQARTTLARIARLEHLIQLQRQGVAHQLTKRLATGHALVAIEDLNTVGMIATPAAKVDPATGAFLPNGRAAKRGLARSILRASFGEIRRQLAYKTSWYGSRLIIIDRWAPTSRTCSTCGTVKPKLPLSERRYTCDDCGTILDRDVNAAKNILAVALRDDEDRATDSGLRSPTAVPAAQRLTRKTGTVYPIAALATATRKGSPS